MPQDQDNDNGAGVVRQALPTADADGWMPWSGGENPVPGQMVEVRLRNGYEAFWLSDALGWAYDNGDGDIIAFCLASTAPVEASGSEVPEGMMTIADELEDKADELDQMDARGQIWGLEEVSDIMRRAATALRPQPSGETREALDRLKMAAHVYEDDEMAADCATLEALLSARPLVLGGQQGASCSIPPPGWTCSRISGHEGPCAASPADGEYE